MGLLQKAKSASTAGSFDIRNQNTEDPLHNKIAAKVNGGLDHAQGMLEDRFGGGGGGGGGGGNDLLGLGASPQRPEYAAANMSNLDQSLRIGNPNNISPNEVSGGYAGLGKAGQSFVNQATQAGPSAWLKMQTQQQGLQQQQAQEDLAGASAGNAAQARTALATKGGLSSGSAERLAKSGARDMTMGQQGIVRQGQENLLGLGVADEQRKAGMLGQAADLETGLTKFNTTNDLDTQRFNVGNNFDAQKFNKTADINGKQFDINNAINQSTNQNNFDMTNYQEQMKQRAGDTIANQINKSGGGGKK